MLAYPGGEGLIIEVGFDKLSREQRARAKEIALNDPRVQEILEEARRANSYFISVFDVFDVFELQEIEDPEKGRGCALVRKENLANVEIRIYKEYDRELGFKVYTVIVDLEEEEVVEIEEHPEARKPKPGVVVKTEGLELILPRPIELKEKIRRAATVRGRREPSIKIL